MIFVKEDILSKRLTKNNFPSDVEGFFFKLILKIKMAPLRHLSTLLYQHELQKFQL